MRIFFLLASAVSLVTTLGYTVADTRKFLNNMLSAPFDETSKLFVQSAYYFPTVDFALATIVLLLVGIGKTFRLNLYPVVAFFGVQFALFAIVQVVFCLRSGLEGALTKLIPWILFTLIAGLIFAGLWSEGSLMARSGEPRILG